MDVLASLVDVWKRCHFPETSGLRILGVRGVKVKKGDLVPVPDVVNEFNDTLFLFDPGAGRLTHVPCTAGQPGWHWIQNNDKGGSPFVRCGCYAYVRGNHREHPEALRQLQRGEDGYVAAVRDANRNGLREFAERSPDTFAYPDNQINIHACDKAATKVGPWSDGCTVVRSTWEGPYWRTVHKYAYDLYSEQGIFPYAIIEEAWIGTATQRLLFGSVGAPVRELQRFLSQKRIACPTTGRFDITTDKAYRQWQRHGGATQDGICVNPPWLVTT